MGCATCDEPLLAMTLAYAAQQLPLSPIKKPPARRLGRFSSMDESQGISLLQTLSHRQSHAAASEKVLWKSESY